MQMREIENKGIWESFLSECEEKSFLSSWNWGEFNRVMGNKIWRLGIYENGELSSVALVAKMAAKRGTFLLVPHGPVAKLKTKNEKLKILEILLGELKKIAKDEKAIFIRVSPIWERNEENNEIFKKLGFKLAPIHVHPEASWKLDIRPSEEGLFMGLRKTTRYLIRQAQKDKDIEIFQSPKIEDIEIFNIFIKKLLNRNILCLSLTNI